MSHITKNGRRLYYPRQLSDVERDRQMTTLWHMAQNVFQCDGSEERPNPEITLYNDGQFSMVRLPQPMHTRDFRVIVHGQGIKNAKISELFEWVGDQQEQVLDMFRPADARFMFIQFASKEAFDIVLRRTGHIRGRPVTVQVAERKRSNSGQEGGSGSGRTTPQFDGDYGGGGGEAMAQGVDDYTTPYYDPSDVYQHFQFQQQMQMQQFQHFQHMHQMQQMQQFQQLQMMQQLQMAAMDTTGAAQAAMPIVPYPFMMPMAAFAPTTTLPVNPLGNASSTSSESSPIVAAAAAPTPPTSAAPSPSVGPQAFSLSETAAADQLQAPVVSPVMAPAMAPVVAPVVAQPQLADFNPLLLSLGLGGDTVLDTSTDRFTDTNSLQRLLQQLDLPP